MPVQMIQSDVSRSNVYQDALKVPPAPPFLDRAGHMRPDGYVCVDHSVAKFVVQPMRLLAQADGRKAESPAGRVKAESYVTVCNSLKAISNITPGPMAQTLRRVLIKRIVKKGAPVVPALVKALKHKNKVVRSGSAEVLGRIFQGTGTSNTWKAILCKLVVVPWLTAALKDRDADVRKAAKKAIDAINRKKTIKPPKIDESNPFQL